MTRRRRENDLDHDGVSLIPIMNLVCLLIPFLLFTAAFVAYAAVDVNAPRLNRQVEGPPPPPEGLDLTLVITDEGFRLASGNQLNLPASCRGAESVGITTSPIPLRADAETCAGAGDRRERQDLRLGPPACAYDYVRLHQCIQDIKAEHPQERDIVISGEPNVEYDVLIRAMDATRGTSAEPLFPVVSLASGLA